MIHRETIIMEVNKLKIRLINVIQIMLTITKNILIVIVLLVLFEFDIISSCLPNGTIFQQGYEYLIVEKHSALKSNKEKYKIQAKKIEAFVQDTKTKMHKSVLETINKNRN